MSRTLYIGLTGGIGSGKTSTTDIFSEFGVPVIDADVISHEVVQSDQPALQAIADSFSPEVIGEDGQLRRNYLRKLIFDDPLARQKLEAIMHPLIFDEIARRLSLVTFPYCIVSSPLLLESRSKHEVDRVLVVDAPEDIQIERTMQRDDSRQDEIKKIIDSQSSRQDRLAAADDIIVNDRDLSYLREQVKALHDKYLTVAANRLALCT